MKENSLQGKFVLNFHFSKIRRLAVVAQWCSVKKVFLEISQDSQEKTCARVSFLMKLQAGLHWATSFSLAVPEKINGTK